MQIEDSGLYGEKEFICPFNSYHRAFDSRKHKYHISRCKDRRGKTIYACVFFSGHIYVKVQDLIEHEKV